MTKNIILTDKRGVASLVILLISLSVTAIFVGGFAFILNRETATVRQINNSNAAFQAAESGIEDVITRLRAGGNPPSPLTFSVGQASVTVTTVTLGNQKIITAVGTIDNVTRTVETVIELNTTDTDFFYGAQVGEGGLVMANNAIVFGSVYSDGSIIGGTQGSTINNDVFVAAGVAPVPDQSWTTQNADFSAGVTQNSAVVLVDSGGDVGDYDSMALGSDQFARISYYDASNKDLKFVRCTNHDCTAKNITTVDSTGDVGYRYSSIYLGSDDFARISYYDNTSNNRDLKFVRCTNNDCTNKNITSADTTGDVGQFSSMALGSDGYARISYYDNSGGNLNFLRCTDSDCTASNKTSVDTSGDVGKYTSITLGSDGFARISYVYAGNNDDLKYVRCTNADCTTKNITTVDSAAEVDYPTSIALGSDGYVRISYYDDASDDLKFVQCTNDDCTTKNITVVDSSGDVGRYGSIKIASDGYARISYYDASSGSVKLAKCTNAACTTNSISVPDTQDNVGLYTSLYLGTDGFARISYRDDDNKDLKFIRCMIDSCPAPTPQVDVAQSFRPSATQRAVKVDLYLKKTGTPLNATLLLIKDSGGSPSTNSDDILATGTINASQVTASYGWLSVGLSSTPTLTVNTIYWLVVDTILDNSNYLIWGGDSTDAYASGTGKRSNDWTAGGWSTIGGDLDFKIYMGGVDYQISSMENIGGNASAHIIDNADVTGNVNAYTYNNGTVGGNINADSISNCTINGNASYNTKATCTVGGTETTPTTPPDDPPHVPLPISEATIAEWKSDAAAGEPIIGDYVVPEGTSYLGPKKITGDLLMSVNRSTLVLTGTVWVQGNIDVANGSRIILDPSFGVFSGTVIADGWIRIENNGIFEGSGQPGSYVMLLSTLACVGVASPSCTGENSGAISLHNNAEGAIFYASNGLIHLNNGVLVTELVGYKISLDPNAKLIYQIGLANASFTSGPSAGWAILSWKEL
ncbi:MAG: hypothetical protein A3A80_02620 [Candidatus Terrybacteria bacterium RIFCSPLOWO2_01_FULL_44_24]|uniref:Type 4 fimbrial biogenesis protein PilX N-terminal domain-containing protein n=1 Tax=Candidatus Terrybacteria bacterium RIFCSPHIGHO2_01_FULL_43_35 TaxID=1802361 RepID=A0A1G2PG40_9BACT|nr:MAG: hypothetical protein A2828_02415 [Candidatus Terrybacteria bacterium RIFCSPHIGHO2_01_FULL_43_35]OHA50281.1 MAG: hypothetical protein A3B75_00580 [Candidatus Terrybacteria bacterium RIFCSPHIGHO2_02_FULL_43_14]OHA50966.1 MAG: hypothetical protein A3A80_02620 [Candidatus Terrybacteria bacterium RIFCSPLOWO2_01_FULL_44_24]